MNLPEKSKFFAIVYQMADISSILNPVVLQECVRNWLKEDSSSFDLQAIIAGDQKVTAKIFCKSSGILAGVPFVNAVFRELECSVEWLCKEGQYLDVSQGIIGINNQLYETGGFYLIQLNFVQ